MSNTKHIAREREGVIFSILSGTLPSITHPLAPQLINQILSDEGKQLSNSFISWVFLKSVKKHETIFPNLAVFVVMSCLDRNDFTKNLQVVNKMKCFLCCRGSDFCSNSINIWLIIFLSNWQKNHQSKHAQVFRDVIVTQDFIRELKTMRQMRHETHPWRQVQGAVQSENYSSRPRKESGYQRQKYTSREKYMPKISTGRDRRTEAASATWEEVWALCQLGNFFNSRSLNSQNCSVS